MKVFDRTVAEKSRRAITKAEREEAHHCGFSCAHRLGGGVAGDGDERIVKAGPLDRQRFDARAAVDQRPEQRLGSAFGKLEHPLFALAPGIGGNGRAPRAVARARPQPNDRPQPRAGLVDAAVERDLALGDDRDPLAQPLGMGDDVGREDDRRAGVGLAADQLLEPALVDRVEPGEGLVEDDQARLVDDRAEQLDGLRHALGQGADRLLRPLAEAVLGEQRVGAAARLRPAADRAARP